MSEIVLDQTLKKILKSRYWNINALLVLFFAVFCSVVIYCLTCHFCVSYQSRVDIYIIPQNQSLENQTMASNQDVSRIQQYWADTHAFLLGDKDIQRRLLNGQSLNGRPYDISDYITIEPLPNGVRFFTQSQSEKEAERLAETLSARYKDVLIVWQNKSLRARNVDKQDLKRKLDTVKAQFEKSTFLSLNIVQDEVLMKSYVEAVIKRIYYDALLEALDNCEREKLSPLSLSAVASSPAIRQKLDRLAQLEANIANQAVKLGKTNKTVLALKAEYSVVEAQLSHEMTMVIRQFSTDRMIAFNVEEQLKKAIFINVNSEEMNSLLATKQSELNNIIQNQIALDNDIALLQTKIEISAVKILEKPHYGYAIIAALLTFVAVLLSFGFIILRHQQSSNRVIAGQEEQAFQNDRHSVDNPAEVEKVEHTKSPISLVMLEKYIDENNYNVIALFGATAEEEGARLALSLFQSGKKALLVDVAGSEITRHIGVHAGLSDVLAGDVPLEDTIYHDDETGVDVLPHGGVSYLRAAAFSHRFPVVLKTLQKSYEVVILTIAAEPFLTLPDLLQREVLKVLVPSRDRALWEETLSESGFTDFLCLAH